MGRFATLALIILLGCSTRTQRLETLFDKARDDLRGGELARAQLSVERGLAVASSRHDVYFQWKFRLLSAEIILLGKRPQEAVAQLGQAMPAETQFASLAARKLMLQGQSASRLGQPERSATLLAEAHRVAESTQADETLTEIENIQGAQACKNGRYDDANRFLGSALRRARALRSPYLEASALVNLGTIPFRLHHYDEAAGFFEEASRRAGPALQLLYSFSQTSLATCYLHLGEYDRAIQIYSGGADLYQRSGAKYYLQLSLGETGQAYLLKGELQAAIQPLQQALAIANEIASMEHAGIWAGNLAIVYSELGDWANAEILNQEAIRLKSSTHVPTLFYNKLNSARIASGRGDLDQSARLFGQAMADGKDDPSVTWEAQEGLGDIAVRQHQPAAAVQHFEAALTVVERTRSGLQRADFKLPFLARLIRFYDAYVNTLVDQEQFDRALAVADSSRAQVLAERYGSAPARRLAPDAFHALARQTNSVLLSYWLGSIRSHAWLVTGSEIHHVELPPAAQIEPLVREYQDAIERRLADPLRTRIPAGERLYQMLIEPVRAWIPAGSRVILTPDGALHSLNFESLPISGDTPRYLIQDLTVVLAPSLALLAGKPPDTHPAHRLLLLGDPVTNDPAFPALTHAAQEIAGVTQRFGGAGNVVLSREAATPDAWRKAGPAAFSAIHFTTHAIANRESPLDSAVLLSGGKLYARDVMDVPLTADLVTFSACRGAGSRNYSGEGLVGFSWAFLRAGARNVIAGLWDVNDQSTAVLMDSLYSGLAAGQRPADALRAAKLAMIAKPDNLHKPYYWAPFQLYTVAP